MCAGSSTWFLLEREREILALLQISLSSKRRGKVSVCGCGKRGGEGAGGMPMLAGAAAATSLPHNLKARTEA